MFGYLLLFASSFLAATVLPFYSEIVLVGLMEKGKSSWILVAVASTGNTLGAVVNWYLGRYLLHFKDRRWFYFKEKQIERMQLWFQKYGVWSLLLSWAPLGGDVLTLIAGIMRVHIVPFLILVGIGKTLRYMALVYLAGITFY